MHLTWFKLYIIIWTSIPPFIFIILYLRKINPSVAYKFINGFVGSYCPIFSYVFCIYKMSLSIAIFTLAIVLSVSFRFYMPVTYHTPQRIASMQLKSDTKAWYDDFASRVKLYPQIYCWWTMTQLIPSQVSICQRH